MEVFFMFNMILADSTTSGSTQIHKFFQGLLKLVGEKTGFDIVFYSTVALLLLNIIVALISVSCSYEKKMFRAIKKLNYFFSKNPNITEQTLIVFNNKMKTVPKNLRYCWQEYMLYRDKAPSDYMDVVTCVDQPLKTSSFSNAIKTANIFGIVISLLSSIAFLSYYINLNVDASLTVRILWPVLVVPALALILNYLVIVLLKLNKTIVTKDLYYNYHDFLRNVNKACLTMPSFVDYEVLFTQKEIKNGIPVLQEYLEKRALEEQRAAEDARLNSQEYEAFDFNELGIENAILLDRAMKESEKYFNVKRDLTEKLNSKESEMRNFAKNFDEVTKDFERKAQAIKESLNQINEQLNNTAVKIEANYLKKRYNEDQVKLQQLEKDYDLASSRFNKQQAELEEECEVLRNEIKERKADVEEAIKVEGKAYANKVYGIINNTVKAQNEPYFAKLEAEKQQMAEQINGMNQTIMNQNAEIQGRQNQIVQIEQELINRRAEIAAMASVKEYFTSLEFKQMVKGNKKAKKAGKVDSSEYDEIISQLQNELTDKQNEVERLNATLQQCQQELANKQAEINEKDEQLAAKNKEIESKNNELQEKNKEIEKHVEDIKNVNEELKSAKNVQPEKVIVEVEKKSAVDEEASKKLSEASKKQKELLSKLKTLEDVEKKNKEEKTKIKNRNLSKLLQIQQGIESENDKIQDNKKKLKKNVDDAISALKDSDKKQ